MKSCNMLITGGAGYIGSHACLSFLEAGHAISVIDNLCNADETSLRRVEALSGRTLRFHPADLRDRAALARVFETDGPFDAVVHFAARKAVGESVAHPLEYYQNNLGGTLALLAAMQERMRDGTCLVFSSSATVYGAPDQTPIPETAPLRPVNPYGHTKAMVEQILADHARAEPRLRVASLRYFNPVGAHPSGRIGEDPKGIPDNLFPFITQVAVGARPYLRVFGRDYPTPDGTGIRDYIHVLDLVAGHLRAVEWLMQPDAPSRTVLNLGTGRGYSVLEAVQSFEKATGRTIPLRFVDRRLGDVAECVAEPALANRLLGWRTTRGLDEMCSDAWRWQSANPCGYRDASL